VLVLMGLALGMLAWLEFRKHGESFRHQYSTQTVVTTGPYRISRHPAYLAYVLIMAGIGLLADNAWVFFFLPVAVLIVDASARREELYLMAKHEGAYRPYRSEVRRWI
jgi:protein-S-isoprenylcysteine O-methyltransferase Ste14